MWYLEFQSRLGPAWAPGIECLHIKDFDAKEKARAKAKELAISLKKSKFDTTKMELVWREQLQG